MVSYTYTASQVFVHFLHPRTPFMIRVYIAEVANKTAASFNDNTLYDKVHKIKGFLEQGLTNVQIAAMLSDSTINDNTALNSSARVSMIVQVHAHADVELTE
jgi:hypothetical protein